MGRPRKMVPELKFLEAENCHVARFAGRRKRYGPDKEAAEARFKADLARWLAGGGVPAPEPPPAGVTVAALCLAHLEAVRPRVSPAQYVHHENAMTALGDGRGDTPAESFGLQDLRAFREQMVGRNARIPRGAGHLLWELLKDGPRPSAEVEAAVLAAGHTRHAYRRARAGLGVTSSPGGGRSRVSSLPANAREPGAARKLSRAYINKHVRIVQRAFRLAAVRGQVGPGVAAELAMLPPLEYREGGRETAARTPAVAADVTAILGALGEPWLSVARLQGLTGMRPGEALAFRWDRVSRDPATPVNVEAGASLVPVSAVRVGEAVVWIYAPGGHKSRHRGKPRLIALGARSQELLAPLLGRPGYVFGTRRGKFRRQTDAYDWEIKIRCRRLGVAEWTPHQLRHGFATVAGQTGDLADLQAQLGHSSAAMTSHYINNLAARAARLAE